MGQVGLPARFDLNVRPAIGRGPGVVTKAYSVPVVGPRELPKDGPVRVWIDGGSGPGHKIEVRPADLAPSELDDGRGPTAIYD